MTEIKLPEPVKYTPEYKYCDDGKVVWVNAADAPVVKSAETQPFTLNLEKKND